MALTSKRFSRDAALQSAANNSPPLRAGAAGDGVKTLQASLVELGFAMPVSTKQGKISADGIYGAETTKVVRDFQNKHGLSADGVAGRDTLTRIDQIYAGLEAAAAAKERFLDRAAYGWT